MTVHDNDNWRDLTDYDDPLAMFEGLKHALLIEGIAAFAVLCIMAAFLK